MNSGYHAKSKWLLGRVTDSNKKIVCEFSKKNEIPTLKKWVHRYVILEFLPMILAVGDGIIFNFYLQQS